MVQDDSEILYVSLHQAPFYPLTGDLGDIDRGAPGTTINIPLPAGTAGDIYRRAWQELALPVVSSFGPDWVLVSAGYDGHIDDPLADFRLLEADFGWVARRLAEVHPPHRIVLALEGGYALRSMERSVAATLAGLGGLDPVSDASMTSPPGAAAVLEGAAEAVRRHWPV
jgi:acetoin utilization deacetylase AcuC-like enzyme